MKRSTKPTRTVYRAVWRHEYLASTEIVGDLHAVFDLMIRLGRKPDELVMFEVPDDSKNG